MIRNPSDKILESLSAFVDNEASEIERHRVLKNFSADAELRDKWRRYHVIGSVMRRERHIASRVDVSAAVAAAIAGEPAVAASSSSQGAAAAGGSVVQSAGTKRWQALVGKTAVAASFAVAIVMGVNQFSSQDTLSQPAQIASAPQAEKSAVTTAPTGFDVPVPAARTVGTNSLSAGDSSNPMPQMLIPASSDDLTDPATQSLLNHLLIEHAARSSANGSMGILPFARVSKMDEEKNR